MLNNEKPLAAVQKIFIFGNSGSGKSTLAKRLSSQQALTYLDLDNIAWQSANPPQRATLDASLKQLNDFMAQNSAWIIEGCYGDIISSAIEQADGVIFMDLPVEHCIENAKSRPFEPHKYASKQAQDDNLDLLLSWIANYTDRDDWSGYHYHNRLFKECTILKQRISSNVAITSDVEWAM